MNFKIVGEFTPYTRMTQRSKWADPRAQKYLASKMQLGYQLRQQMDGQPMYPKGLPLSLIARIVSTKGLHGRDLSNELKALEDSANQIVYHDDRYIDHILISRGQGEVNTCSLDVLPLAARVQWCCPCCGRAVIDG